MAVTTVDGVIAGGQAHRMFMKYRTAAVSAARWATTWAYAGMPEAGAYDTTLNGVALTGPVQGGLVCPNPSSGNAYLARAYMVASGQACMIMLYDRLWHNGGFTITSTSAQSITSPTWPARDANGSTNGDGVYLALEVSAAVGAGTPTITVGYTNSAGTSGRSATNVIAALASSATGTMYHIGLQGADAGVRSVQSLTLSATWTSGTINLVAYRPIACIVSQIAAGSVSMDAVLLGLPRIYDNSVLYFAINQVTTTAMSMFGSLGYTHG
jgi:hypothetical protein